uniref:Uncharacterized protein n=1 Tax=uncultured bacterium contig00064 TaxID=1181547 RepID=A0A806KI39_9BACT|nr:hypothetical protein [uncultured bacterium contig00064]
MDQVHVFELYLAVLTYVNPPKLINNKIKCAKYTLFSKIFPQ